MQMEASRSAKRGLLQLSESSSAIVMPPLADAYVKHPGQVITLSALQQLRYTYGCQRQLDTPEMQFTSEAFQIHVASC